MNKDTKDVVVTLRIPRELHESIKAVAIANDRPTSAELRVAARRHVEATREASASAA